MNKFILKTKAFEKWQNTQPISNKSLLVAVEEMLNGLIDANLGGKKRVKRDGYGKSSSYRTLLATNKSHKWFFIYGFAKNEKSNITNAEEKALKQLTKDLLSMNSDKIAIAIKQKVIIEVKDD